MAVCKAVWYNDWYNGGGAHMAYYGYNETKKSCNARYAATQERIYISIPKGKKEIYKEMADQEGKSLNKYIIDLIEEDMKKKNDKK